MTYGRKSCRGQCPRENWEYKENMTRYRHNVYERGYKRCNACDIFISGFVDCPCCGLTLKVKPINNKNRRALNAKLGVVSY